MKLYYPFYYLFYRIAKMNDVLFPEYAHTTNQPIMFSVSLKQSINVFSILIIMEHFLNFELMIKKRMVWLFIFFSIINYFAFLWKGRDKNIYKMFDIESAEKRKRGIIFTWIYIVVTYGLLIYAFIIK